MTDITCHLTSKECSFSFAGSQAHSYKGIGVFLRNTMQVIMKKTSRKNDSMVPLSLPPFAYSPFANKRFSFFGTYIITIAITTTTTTITLFIEALYH